MDIDSLVQEKLDADTDFQDEIAILSDEEKETAIAEKKQELVKLTFKEVHEKATKNEELAKNYKTRAEKAEAERKEKGETKPKNDDLSQKDLLSIVRADVHDDDVDRVVKFAKLEGISIADALKHSDLKAILSSRAEARKSAEATSVKPARSGAPKVSPEIIVAQASKGGENIPKAGTPEAEALYWARRGGKR